MTKQPRGNAGKGRKKGVPNRVTGDVREMIRMALRAVGEDCGGRGRRAGVAYLRKQAHENPKAFLALVGKLMPTEIKSADGGLVSLEQIVLLSLEQRRVDEGEVIDGTALPAPSMPDEPNDRRADTRSTPAAD